MSTVVVSGANGFVGGHACRDLATAGWSVRALVRRPWPDAPAGLSTVILPDGSSDAALREALAGATAVVHLAARAHVLSETPADGLDAFRQANVALTARVLAAAEAAGVARFVFLSSIGAVCSSSDSAVTDRTPPAPTSTYGRSKLEAEALVLGHAGRAMRRVVLRPPMVYGPGMRGNPLRLFDLVDRAVPLPLGSVRNRRTLLYVGNLTAAIAAVLRSDVADGAYAVGDAESWSTPALIRAIAAALGKADRLLSVPEPLLRALGKVGDIVNHLVRVPFSTDDVSRLVSSLEIDSSGLTAAAGYRPALSATEGLRRTAAWYRGRRG